MAGTTIFHHIDYYWTLKLIFVILEIFAKKEMSIIQLDSNIFAANYFFENYYISLIIKKKSCTIL